MRQQKSLELAEIIEEFRMMPIHIFKLKVYEEKIVYLEQNNAFMVRINLTIFGRHRSGIILMKDFYSISKITS